MFLLPFHLSVEIGHALLGVTDLLLPVMAAETFDLEGIMVE